MLHRSRSDVDVFVLPLLMAAFLLTSEVAGGHVMRVPASRPGRRHGRSLLDEDLVSAGLSILSGPSGPRGRCCKQLTLCDLATTLLEAIEANKAQDAETLRKRKVPEQQQRPYMGPFGRFRRAHSSREEDDDSPPHPAFREITRTCLRRLREHEEAERQEELRRAREVILKQQQESQAEQEEYEDEGDEDGGAPAEDRGAVQRIS